MPSITDFEAQRADASDEPSVQVTSGATQPGAGATVATVNAPKSGLYEICVVVGYGATADVVDNMDLAVNGVQVCVLPVVATANGPRTSTKVRVRANSGQAIAVRAVAAGAVGSVYRAHIVATRVLD